jgi:DNA-binding NarL/FixJ family response regulator
VSGLPVTYRQMQILAGIARGLPDKAIGKQLYIAESSVKTHVRRLYHRLGASDRAHAVAIAYDLGLLRHGASGHTTTTTTGGNHA